MRLSPCLHCTGSDLLHALTPADTLADTHQTPAAGAASCAQPKHLRMALSDGTNGSPSNDDDANMRAHTCWGTQGLPMDASSSGSLQASLEALERGCREGAVVGALTLLATKPMQVGVSVCVCARAGVCWHALLGRGEIGRAGGAQRLGLHSSSAFFRNGACQAHAGPCIHESAPCHLASPCSHPIPSPSICRLHP